MANAKAEQEIQEITVCTAAEAESVAAAVTQRGLYSDVQVVGVNGHDPTVRRIVGKPENNRIFDAHLGHVNST